MAFFLTEPFPQRDAPEIIVRNALIFGASITFILAVFQPFTFGEAGAKVWQYALIFGGITAAVILLFEFTLKYVFRLQRDQPGWTLWKWCLSNLLLACCIAVANYIFTTYEYGLSHSWYRFQIVLRSTLAIGILPVLAVGATIQARLARRNERIAATISLPGPKPVVTQLVQLPILHSDKSFTIDAQNILCIEAMQNYVQIYFLEEDKLNKEMLRNTISNIAEVLSDTSIQRSHRSFLVNKDRIDGISGNAQGLKLELAPSPGFWVPVSRKYIPDFKILA